MVGVMVVIATSFKRTYVSMLHLPGLLYSVFLTPQQVTVDTLLSQRLLDTHRQVWFSLYLGHCSFLLGPGAHLGFVCALQECCPSPVEVL